MACPQPKYHTKLSNELLTALYRLQLPSANAYRLVLWVARDSYGWRRHFSRSLSLKDLAAEVNMEKSSVHLALKVLIDAKILTRDAIGKLKIQKDYELWGVQPTGRKEKKSSSPLEKSSSQLDEKSSPLDAYKEKERERKGKKEQIAPTAALQTNLDSKKPLTGIQKVMRGFKEAKGIDANDAAWDTLHFKRFARAAADLLKVFNGNADAAIVYTLKKGDELDGKQLLGWGLEAVARAAATDPKVLNFMGGSDGSEHQPVVTDSLDGPRSTGRFTSSGSLAGDALRAIGQAGVPEKANGDMGSDEHDYPGNEY